MRRTLTHLLPDEGMRRASTLEKRAAHFAYPALRAALLNTAAQYRNRANQTVATRADAKREDAPAEVRFHFGSDQDRSG
jgi:hypothetical protein